MNSTQQAQPINSVSGVLFSRSVRSSFASLSLAPLLDVNQNNDEDLPEPILVRVQFFDEVTELRSFCRRKYKLGDLLDIQGGHLQNIGDSAGTEWNKPRMVINASSIEDASKQIVVTNPQLWTMKECQLWQNQYFPKKVPSPPKSRNEGSCSNHGGGLGKRLQGEHVANFLIHCIMQKILDAQDKDPPREVRDWSNIESSTYSTLRDKAIERLNSGTGVIDIAGGSGHVSMALGLAGIQSTVVDARPGVGRLPGRDRKIWNREMKKSLGERASNVLAYKSHRAWFGCRPTGVDSTFRHPDEAHLPLCDETSDLIKRASAIVALHPDEATGDIVKVAVIHKIPFVIIPCCVFCRLFPERRKASNNEIVSTYEDLIQYLLEQSQSIKKSQLPFDGKNTVLWSTF